MKTLPVLAGVLAVFYLAMLARDIEVPTVLAVEDIHVEGELYFLDAAQIRDTVREHTRDGYFAMDLKQVRELLLQLPWVKDVALRRQWPADLTVIVEEQVPVAYWNDDGFVSEAGEVFRPAPVDTSLPLPQLRGPEKLHDKVLAFMNRIYGEMQALGFKVTRLELDDRRAWNMALQSTAELSSQDDVASSIDIKLGRFETDKRLQRFMRVLPALVAQMKRSENSISVIDMRYPNGFAVQLQQPVKSDVISQAVVSPAEESLSIKNMTHDSVRRQPNATAQMSEV